MIDLTSRVSRRTVVQAIAVTATTPFILQTMCDAGIAPRHARSRSKSGNIVVTDVTIPIQMINRQQVVFESEGDERGR